MKRNNPKVKGKQRYRFYKSNLPKIVWDPNRDRKLADFDGGSFTTDDIKVAQFLLKKGYPQIPVDATEPPNVLVRIPGKSLVTDMDEGAMTDIKVGPAGFNQETGVRVPVIQKGPSLQ